MATGWSDVASDEIPDFVCITCNNKEVAKYCVECQGYCCKSCLDAHLQFPTLKGHTLLDPSNSTVRTIPTERCHIHTVKIVDMYCQDHDDVGCTTCMTLNHRLCRDVYSIPDDIDELFKATEKEETNRCLQSYEERLESIEITDEENLTELNLSREEADMTIDNAKREIIDHVENLAKQAKEVVGEEFQATKDRIEHKMKKSNKRVEEIKTMLFNLKSSKGNKSQQFVNVKIANRKIKEADLIDHALQYNEEVKLSYDVDSSLQTFSHDIKIFGRVCYNTGATRYNAESVRDVNVKVQNDKSTCDVFGSCLSEDGRLLFVDYSNKKLKRLNIETMTVDGVGSFDNNPISVCCTDKGEAVVTFYTTAHFIQFVSIGAKLTPLRKINIKHNCWGVSYKDEKLYITDNAQTLYVNDMAGNELQIISTDNSGNDIFSQIRDISFNEYMRGFVIADCKRGVIILNDQYERIAGYSNAALQSATSVCTDGRGSIFVCGYYSHNVLQIGQDGKEIGDVIDNLNRIQKAQKPQSLCFDSTRCSLIITQKGRDIVKIIQLK